MTTVSDVFPAVEVGGSRSGSPSAVSGSAGGARTRARASVAVTDGHRKIGRWVASEARAWWWTPDSLPTLARAWAERMPDRERVPGGNPVLYGGWVAYNHVALIVPAAALAVVGVLTIAVWVARHPARLALAAALASAITFLVLK